MIAAITEFDRRKIKSIMQVIESGKRRGRKAALDDLSIIAMHTEIPEIRTNAIAVLDELYPDWRPDWMLEEIANGARWHGKEILGDAAPKAVLSDAARMVGSTPPAPFRRLSAEELSDVERYVTANPGCRMREIAEGLQWENHNRLKSLTEKLYGQKRLYRRKGQHYPGIDPNPK